MTASPAAPRPAPHSARRNHGVAATRWLALKALARCLPLAGLLKNRMYTYRWVSLVIWLYFTEGVVRGWGDRPPSQWLAWGEAVLCLVLFAACPGHGRLG